jgi:hypothetical protein
MSAKSRYELLQFMILTISPSNYFDKMVNTFFPPLIQEQIQGFVSNLAF